MRMAVFEVGIPGYKENKQDWLGGTYSFIKQGASGEF